MLTLQKIIHLNTSHLSQCISYYFLSKWIRNFQGPLLLWRILHALIGFAWVAVPHLPVTYKKYKNAHEADLYWHAAEQANRALQASNAANAPDGLSLITYYTPKLLPPYRESITQDPEAKEVYISPRTFCKWHRMVHRGPVCPRSLLGAHTLTITSSFIPL